MKALPPDKSANGNGKSAGGGQHGNGRDFAPGRDPRRGHGPAKGHGGRPCNEFHEEMRALAEKQIPQEILADIRQETIEKLLHDHPGMYLQVMALRHRVWADAADRGYDRPAAKQATSDDREQRFVEGVPILSLEEWRKKFAAGNR